MELKKAITFLTVVTLLVIGRPVSMGGETERDNSISEIMLTPASLPPDMTIAREVWASPPQLLRIRMRVGFPLDALLNQTIMYEGKQARVNYMVPSDEKWLVFGYSKLINTDGDRSFIVKSDDVIVQIAATTKELEDRIAYMLKADPVQYHKIRISRLSEDWIFVKEKYLLRPELEQVEQNLDVRITSALVQEFIRNRLNVKVTYYNCDTPQAAESVARRIAAEDRLFIKRAAEVSGSVVIIAESQDEKLTGDAMALVNR